MIVELTGDGSLVVSNQNARVALLKEGSAGQQSWLNMATLNSFKADVDRVGLGDYMLYPNWSTNGYEVTNGGAGTNQAPARWLPQVRLARTNVIRATLVDTNNYNDPFVREYPLSIGLNAEQGTTADLSFYFGLSNAFFMDAICFGQFEADLGGDTFLRFNPNTNSIPTNAIPVVVFRNTDGVSPMSALVCGDGVSTGAGDNAVRGNLNLSRGKVDALVDRLYLGRDRQEGASRSPSVGEMNIADGFFIANTAYLGCNLLTNNISTDNTNTTETCEVTGTLTVQSNAVLVVNDTMHLGYTTADETSVTNVRGAELCYGYLQVQNGGRAMINSIVIGGGDEPNATKLSQNNRVQITGGGELIVSNRIGQADKWLATFTMNDSTLTLHMDGSQSTPYVYATNVVGGGSGNKIKVANIDNVVSFPTQLPVIAYETASPNFGVEFVEPNRYGYIVDNTANKTIDVVILDTPPNNLIWDGAAGTEWSTSSANWKGGAIFTNGDTATFDDTAVNPTANVTETVYLGGFGVLVTNNTKSITLTGAGSLSGTAPMNKWGTNSLAVNVTSALPLTVNEGSVSGSGAIGSTVVRSNASLTFAGSVNKLESAGTATLSAGGTVANGVRVTGGTFTNSGRVTGTLDVTNALVQLNLGSSITMPVPSTSVIRSNATVDLDGIWTNGPAGGAAGTYRITLLGTLTGTGTIRTGTPDIQHASGESPDYWSRLVIESGGVLSPGATAGSLAVLTNSSQLDFSPGSRIIIDVNTDSADGSNPMKNAQTGSLAAKNSDVVFSSRWSTRTGTLRMNRVGTTPWTNGMVLKVFGKPFENFNYLNRVFDGTETQMPVMDPASPGLGLVWSLQDFATNGVIRIFGTASTPTNLVATVFEGTNVTFSWPSNYTGWELQTQTRTLTNGLSMVRSNWTVVAGSTTTNAVTITNWINKSSGAVFYRLGHPTFE